MELRRLFPKSVFGCAQAIGVNPRIVKNLESYRNGKFTECIKTACDNADKIREIIERVSGRELPSDWFPWSPLDANGSLEGVTVTGMNIRWFTLPIQKVIPVHPISR